MGLIIFTPAVRRIRRCASQEDARQLQDKCLGSDSLRYCVLCRPRNFKIVVLQEKGFLREHPWLKFKMRK